MKKLEERLSALEAAQSSQVCRKGGVEFIPAGLTKAQQESYKAKVEAAHPNQQVIFFVPAEMEE